MFNRQAIKKLAKNEYIFSLLTKCIMVVIGLAESALLARYLGAQIRGELSYIYSMASTAYLIITFGIYTAYPFKRKEKTVNIQNLLNEFMTVICILFTFYIIVMYIGAVLVYPLNDTMSIVLLMLPIMGYDKVSSFVFMIEHPNRMNFITMLVNIIQCLYLVLLIIFTSQNLLAGVGYYLLGCILKSIYFTFKLHFKFQIKQFSFCKLVDYIKFGFFPMIALLLTTLNYRLDVIMLKQYNVIELTQIGIYSIGIGFSEKALLIPDTIKDVLLSKLAKGKGEKEVARVMRICFLASIVTAAVITLFGGFIISTLYGSEYYGAEQVTYISVWGTITMVFFKMISQYNVIQHKQHLNVIFLIVAIGVNFALNLLLIPVFGINGAAIATTIGHLISAGIFLVYFRKISGISYLKMIFIQKEDLRLLHNFIAPKE